MEFGVDEVDLVDDAARIQVIESDYYGTGRVPWNGAFVLKHRWYVEEANGASSYTASDTETAGISG